MTKLFKKQNENKFYIIMIIVLIIAVWMLWKNLVKLSACDAILYEMRAAEACLNSRMCDMLLETGVIMRQV